MADRFEVKGLRELGEAIRTLKAETALKYCRSATAASAAVVKKHAKRNVQSSPSIITRTLYNAIITKRIPRGQTQLTSEHIVTVRGRGKKTRKGTVQAGAPYAHFVEFGTEHMRKEPFLRPALENNLRAAAEAMKKPLERGIIKSRSK